MGRKKHDFHTEKWKWNALLAGVCERKCQSAEAVTHPTHPHLSAPHECLTSLGLHKTTNKAEENILLAYDGILLFSLLGGHLDTTGVKYCSLLKACQLYVKIHCLFSSALLCYLLWYEI